MMTKTTTSCLIAPPAGRSCLRNFAGSKMAWNCSSICASRLLPRFRLSQAGSGPAGSKYATQKRKGHTAGDSPGPGPAFFTCGYFHHFQVDRRNTAYLRRGNQLIHYQAARVPAAGRNYGSAEALLVRNRRAARKLSAGTCMKFQPVRTKNLEPRVKSQAAATPGADFVALAEDCSAPAVGRPYRRWAAAGCRVRASSARPGAGNFAASAARSFAAAQNCSAQGAPCPCPHWAAAGCRAKASSVRPEAARLPGVVAAGDFHPRSGSRRGRPQAVVDWLAAASSTDSAEAAAVADFQMVAAAPPVCRVR